MARYQLSAAVMAPGSGQRRHVDVGVVVVETGLGQQRGQPAARPVGAEEQPLGDLRRAERRHRLAVHGRPEQRVPQGQRMRRRDDAERADPPGMLRRHDPGQHAAPVVAHQVEGLHLHAVGERQDVAHEVLGRVVTDLGRAGAGAVAPLVGRHGPVPGPAERRQLVAPGPRRLGEAVEEQDPPALVRAAGPAREDEAAGRDLEPVDGPAGVHDAAPRPRSHPSGRGLLRE